MRVFLSVALLLLGMASTTTTPFGGVAAEDTALQTAIKAKESALDGLATKMQLLYGTKCSSSCSSATAASSECSVPSCGNDFTNDSGFGCTNKVGNSTALCGTDCLGMRRNQAKSTVGLAPEVNFTNPETHAFVCSTSEMDASFKANYDAETSKSWSYVADRTGTFRIFPGLPQERETDTCSNYDPRLRPWYIEATSGPKDIVFMLDVGMGMSYSEPGSTGINKLQLARNSIKQVIETMTENDFVGVFIYSGSTTAKLVDSSVLNADGKLVRVSEASKESLFNALNDVSISTTDATADYAYAYGTALSVMRDSVQGGMSANCTQVILSMMDAAPTGGAEALTPGVNLAILVGQQNLLAVSGHTAHIFAYTVSLTTTPADTVTFAKAIACANNGLYDMLSLSDQDHFTNMAGYYHFLSLMSASVGADTVRWSLPYEDAFGLGMVVTGSKMVIHTSGSHKHHVGVAAMDVTLAELETHEESLDVVMAELALEGSTCPTEAFHECLLQKLRAESSMGYVCPSTTECTPPTGGCAATETGNLNDLLCESLNPTTRLSAASVTPATTKEVSCCTTMETCDANLWEGAVPEVEGDSSCGSDVTGVVVAVVGDWDDRLLSQGLNSELTSEIVQDSLPKYLVDLSKATLGGNASCAFELVLIDAQGAGQTKAMQLYVEEIVVNRGLVKNQAAPWSNKTLLVVVQGGSELMEAVLHYVDPSVPVIAAKSADFWVADEELWPNTVTLLPSGAQVAEALLSASIAFQWDSVAILYPEQSQYGFSMQSNVERVFVEAGAKSTQAAPVVVTTVKMADADFNAQDAEVALTALAENSPVGIIAFVTPVQYEVLSSVQLQMAATNPIVANFYFILPSDCVGVLTDNALAVNTPFSTKHSQLPYGVVSSDTQTQMSLRSFVDISALFDALRVTWDAMGPSSSTTTTPTTLCDGNRACIMAKILAVTFTEGFTGEVAFNVADQARSVETCLLTFNTNQITRPIGMWSGLSGFMAVAGQLDFVPKSPLKTVTICLLAMDACHDITNVDHMIYAFRQTALKNQFFLDNNVKINTVAMQTGFDAVSGMRNLLADANRCNFLTGPGLSSVAFALTPIINAYQIPQMDYSATSTAFTDKVKYPFFSRTQPSNAPLAQVYAEVVTGFQWDRVVLMTTEDDYGTHMARMVAEAMANKNIDVENSHHIVPNPEGVTDLNPYLEPLLHVKDQAISRIVLVLLPVDSDNAKIFLRTAHYDLGMETTHVFLFGDVLCQIMAADPDLREGFIGSICLRPYVNNTMFTHIAAEYQDLANSISTPISQMTDETVALAAERQAQTALLQDGGFTNAASCDMGHVDMYSPYAFDAAQVLVDVIQRALGGGTDQNEYTSLTNGTGLTALIRSTVLTCPRSNEGDYDEEHMMNMSMVDHNHFMSSGRPMPTTGNLSFEATGDRVGSAFTVDIQQAWPVATVEFANWSSKTQQYIFYDEQDLPYGPLRWFDNTSTVPKVTTRSIAFIATQTLSTHPGTILMSLFGFIITLCVFGFCYRHQKAKQDEDEIDMVEEQMGGVAVPSEYPDRPDNYADAAPTFSMTQQPEI